ncbi:SDR family oxidoreductase [Actinophytocola xanthii]|uniref:NAD(P)-dependent oxidoreductase n=1 Tax=Actinophytocola xanthii TaxID=1912961 RepID=A0A1Q8CVH6_9PSEU|nr:SDR family oxidoreductase [Actinophytocola xanthii]OLF18334.1 NAD(P)-dependent oxidoreductase [Actinophytocola xanthii]
MILVTGASGPLGRLVVVGLPTDQVIAGARRPQAVADLGVQVRELDYDRAETIDLDGVDTLLLISGNAIGRRVEQHGAVVDAAKRAGVGHIVYTSAPHADATELVVAPEHRATEEIIRASGIPFTFLRNGWYHENYTETIARAAETGEIVGSAGDGRVASAARADFAAAAVAVLTANGRYENAVLELTGDRAWSLPELAAEIAEVTGRPVEYRDLTPDEHRAHLEATGTPAEVAGFVVALEQNIAAGLLAHTPGELRELIGRPTTPLRAAVAEALAGVPAGR